MIERSKVLAIVVSAAGGAIAIGTLLLAPFAIARQHLVARGPNWGDTWPRRWR